MCRRGGEGDAFSLGDFAHLSATTMTAAMFVEALRLVEFLSRPHKPVEGTVVRYARRHPVTQIRTRRIIPQAERGGRRGRATATLAS